MVEEQNLSLQSQVADVEYEERDNRRLLHLNFLQTVIMGNAKCHNTQYRLIGPRRQSGGGNSGLISDHRPFTFIVLFACCLFLVWFCYRDTLIEISNTTFIISTTFIYLVLNITNLKSQPAQRPNRPTSEANQIQMKINQWQWAMESSTHDEIIQLFIASP